MRSLMFPILIFACGCDRAPARIVVGVADTVVINTSRPGPLPVRVLDRTGRALADTAVRYQWRSGDPISLTAEGVVTCAEAGDATVRASIGPLVTDALVRCRPVREVLATRMLNLIVGDPAQDLPLEATGMVGKPVTLLSVQVTVEDSAVVSVDGFRIRALSAGRSGLTMRVGNRTAFTNVQAYAPLPSPESLQPGQRVAVRVRLSGGELRRWKLDPSPQLYFIGILPENDDEQTPGIAIVGANCDQALGPNTFFCLARQGMSLIVYHPQTVDAHKRLSGNLVVWRQEWVQ
jgi:hypothetical protein